MKRKITAWILTVLTAMSAMSVTAFASEGDTEEFLSAVEELNVLMVEEENIEKQLENAEPISGEEVEQANELLAKTMEEAVVEEEAAVSEIEEANQQLQVAAEDFRESFRSYSTELLKEIGTTAITGVALETAEVTSDVIDLVIRMYEKRIASVEEQLASVEDAIEKADQAIENTQEQITAENSVCKLQ